MPPEHLRTTSSTKIDVAVLFAFRLPAGGSARGGAAPAGGARVSGFESRELGRMPGGPPDRLQQPGAGEMALARPSCIRKHEGAWTELAGCSPLNVPWEDGRLEGMQTGERRTSWGPSLCGSDVYIVVLCILTFFHRCCFCLILQISSLSDIFVCRANFSCADSIRGSRG